MFMELVIVTSFTNQGNLARKMYVSLGTREMVNSAERDVYLLTVVLQNVEVKDTKN